VGNRVAIVGVGFSEVARLTDLSYKDLTVQSARAALDDAGMRPDDVDGIVLHAIGQPEANGESPESAINVLLGAQMLGMSPVNFYAPAPTNFGDSVNAAIAAVRAGFCHTCIAIHPCRTARRKPPPGSPPVSPSHAAAAPMRFGGDYQFSAPFGPPGGAGIIAGLAMQRHMSLYGTTEEQFAAQQVVQRSHAALNEDALFRDPITVDDYLASRWISRPARLLDCDYPCDASGAVIFTTEERAANWRKPPVFVEAAAMAATHTTWEYLDDIFGGATAVCADTLWSRTSLTPADIDCAQLYDGFSIIARSWLESLGFCGPGESGPFIEEGHTRLGGTIPMNTDGGSCNVGRRHGSGHCIEAVRQLRGECGARQVSGAEAAIFTVAHGPNCHAVLLTSS
jgi:acetyl-CoA acetyltransferase